MSLIHREFAGNGDFVRESIAFGSVNPNTVVTGSITEIEATDCRLSAQPPRNNNAITRQSTRRERAPEGVLPQAISANELVLLGTITWSNRTSWTKL